jgi:nucleotide-binding universal stress UspA family protein
MEKASLRVLLAFDGSDLSLEAARYIAAIMPARQTEVVLFYVESDVSQSFWQIEKQLDYRFHSTGLRAQMASSHKRINTALEQARSILTGAGFSDNAVSIKIKDKTRGVVNDIIRESQEGYDAIVLGRTGSSKIKDVLLGTVPAKLLKKVQGIPVIIVDGQSYRNHRMLVAFDGSKEVLRAVQSLSFLVGAGDCKVCLCHVMPRQGPAAKEDESHCRESEIQRMEPHLNKSKQCLFDAGLAFNQIGCEMVHEGTSRSSSILRKAKEENYGTVVIGRRGLTALEELFFGRVGEKIFQQAKDVTVWVMG